MDVKKDPRTPLPSHVLSKSIILRHESYSGVEAWEVVDHAGAFPVFRETTLIQNVKHF